MLYQCFNHDFKHLQVYTGCVSPGIVNTPTYVALAEAMHSPAIDEKVCLAFQAFLTKNKPLQPSVVACFLQWLLCETDVETFTAHEWDIGDTSHHPHWVKGFAAPKPLDYS